MQTYVVILKGGLSAADDFAAGGRVLTNEDTLSIILLVPKLLF